MDKYYHFTSYNCLDNINCYGLVPQTGFRCFSINDDRCGVFLSKGIDKSIMMYASLLWFYENHSGQNGLMKINEYQSSIIRWQKVLESGIDYKLACERIEELNKEIQKTNLLVNCNQFSDYLGGNGCILSVSKLDNVDENHKEDCCYNNVIPPSNINIVYLKNKTNGEIIDSRETLITYFMNFFSPEMLANGDIDTLKQLRNLYAKMYNYGYANDLKTNYELKEEPINSYNYINNKIKTLIY